MLYPYEVNKWKNIFLSKGQQKLCLDFFFFGSSRTRRETRNILLYRIAYILVVYLTAVPLQLQRLWAWFWWYRQASESSTRNAAQEDLANWRPQSIRRQDHWRRVRWLSLCDWEELPEKQWRDTWGAPRHATIIDLPTVHIHIRRLQSYQSPESQ